MAKYSTNSTKSSKNSIWIKRITVKGLHNRINFDVKLSSNLNIIYGKNGLGKTTLLHILANITECDFERFSYLSFNEIIVENNHLEKLKIKKIDRRGYIVYINDEIILQNDDGNSMIAENFEDSSALAKVKKVVGDNPTYLPAFRSVLERSNESGFYRSQEVDTAAFDTIIRREGYFSRRVNFHLHRALPRRHNTNSITAIKTLRCREWFGEFVPVIRYPSIVDVTEGLSEEWRQAMLLLGRDEQKIYEQAFLEIFETILIASDKTNTINQIDILSRIKELLNNNNEMIPTSRFFSYDKLVKITKKAGEYGENYNSVLEIYRKLLEQQMDSREKLIAPIMEFQSSVNRFLDQKELKIGLGYGVHENEARISRDRAVRIHPISGNPYSLRALSSGERHITTILYSSRNSISTKGMLLIDEPELSLHIDWQRIILKEMMNQNPDRQVIACTHSPEVGADHRECIIFFNPTSFENNVELSDMDIDDDEL